MTNLKLLVAILFIAISTNLYSQVKDIKEDIKNDNKSNSYTVKKSKSTYKASNYSYEEKSIGESLAEEIFLGIVKGVVFITYEAQRSVLENRVDYPNIISLESSLDYGTTFNEDLFQPSLRLNWGIFATDFRYTLLNDNTDNLQSIDWQVLVVRVPIKNLKINYGIGFTSVLSPKSSYFESSTGFDLSLWESKFNFITNYRWTERKSERRYRQEVKIECDYQINEDGLWHFSPMVGCTYQEYFNKHRYLFVNIGLRIRLSRN